MLLIISLSLDTVPASKFKVLDPSCWISIVQLLIVNPEMEAIVEAVSVDTPTCIAVS